METRSELLIKIHSLQRYVIWQYLQPIVNNVRVAEFPKSGGTWLCQMLSNAMDLPFHRNTSLSLKKSVQHAHHLGPTKYKTVVLIRDGRDVITSAYFHFLMSGEKKHANLVRQWRKKLGEVDFDNVLETMPLFIKTFHNSYRVGGRVVNWGEHVTSYDQNTKNLILVRYEDLLKDAKGEIEKILNWYSIEPTKNIEDVVKKYSFENQTGRSRGEERADSFLRKGVAGDWINYFNDESKQLCNNYYKTALDKYGYV